jgi:hypothetical protein
LAKSMHTPATFDHHSNEEVRDACTNAMDGDDELEERDGPAVRPFP